MGLEHLSGDPFDALGDPHRRAIVELLAARARSVQELADDLPISRPAVSRHLRLLKAAGLVTDSAEGTRRLYRLHDEGIDAVRNYLLGVWGDAARALPHRRRQSFAAAPGETHVMEPIVLEFAVGCSPEQAFEVWAQRTTTWWPHDHTVSGDRDVTVTIEPRAGGRIFERTADGVEHDWGEVVAWDPPRRLTYSWHLAADRSDATEVEVTFTPAATGTTVAIVHRGWERLGVRAEDRRGCNRAGWAGLLPHFERACEKLAS